MPTPWDLISKFLVPETDPAVYAKGLKMLATDPNLFGKELSQQIQEQIASPEAAAFGGIDPMMSVVMPNYRTPQMIQALRKKMAEEMRSRGLLGGGVEEFQRVGKPGSYLAQVPPDPVDRILRGSWYHGMSEEARLAAARRSPEYTPDFSILSAVNEKGFPISHHDALSLSNKFGEPSGVSLSMLPTKAKQFSADEYIHRVLPMYGGTPPERTVNLMTPEGRKALNDAYDVVANKHIRDMLSVSPKSLVEELSYPGATLGNITVPMQQGGGITAFNQALSQQLQSQGKRGLLYNPRRWDEYEMLMLDPKYVLPVDYRRVEEYLPKGFERSSSGYHNVVATPSIEGATPGIQKGLSQIQDLMSSNASRLGDIYSERPWTQRLSEENKGRLLELIDSKYREQVGRQLYGGP